MKVIPIALLSLLAACGAVTGPSPVSGASPSSGLTSINQSVRVGKLMVKPIAVIEDSRCPINARCIWAGRLVLSTDLRLGKWHERRNLILGVVQPVPGGKLSLVSAEPGRLAGAQANPPANRFAFEFAP